VADIGDHRSLAAAPARSLSAVVLSYNGRALLAVVLPSLERQTQPAQELIVVDNGSTDGTREWLAENWPRVKVVHLPRNIGVAAALNRGVAAATGEYVALLNNDLELTPEWLAEMAAGLDRHPEAASVACKLLGYHDRARLDGAGDILTRRLVAFRRGSGELDAGQYDREEEILTPSAGAALYRASAFVRVGPFDESFWAYFEDVDWGLRAQLAGLRSWYVPSAVAYHMGGATTGGDTNPFYLVLHHRNRIGLMAKDLPLSVLLHNAPAILREQAGTFVHGARNGTLRLYLRAWLGAITRLPGWLRDRRRIQRQRRVPASRVSELLED
jgi:GT2 family glycosyltransferase